MSHYDQKSARASAVRLTVCSVAAFALTLVCTQEKSHAQLIQSSSPFTTVRSSFYERIGIDFGFSIGGTRVNNINDRTRGVFGYGPGGIQPNITFSQGGVNSAVPPFGGYDPNADGTFGYQVRNGGSGYHLGMRFGKGNSRTLTNTTPTVVTRNGQTGSIFSGSATPFVTGVVPVVGRGGYSVPSAPVTYVNPLEMKLRQLHMDQANGRKYTPPTRQNNSSPVSASRVAPTKPTTRFFGNPDSTATRGDLSVKEIKRLRALEQQAQASLQDAKANDFVAKSDAALKSGQAAAARSYLRTAIRYSTGNRKVELQKRLDEMLLRK